MKKWILTFSLLLAGCRDESADQNQQLQRLQGQLAEQREKTGTWQGTSAILGIGCVLMLVVGAAIGSKARKAVNDEHEQ